MGDLNIEMAAKPVPRQTIRTLAAEIRQRWPGLEVKVESVTANTDRKIGRLRWPGKGRKGTRLIVRDPSRPEVTAGGFTFGMLLLDHNNAETYRRTEEVRKWIDNRMIGRCGECGHMKGRHRKGCFAKGRE